MWCSSSGVHARVTQGAFPSTQVSTSRAHWIRISRAGPRKHIWKQFFELFCCTGLAQIISSSNHKLTPQKERKRNKKKKHGRNRKKNEVCIASSCLWLPWHLTTMAVVGVQGPRDQLPGFKFLLCCVTCIKLSSLSMPSFTHLTMSLIMILAVIWGLNYVLHIRWKLIKYLLIGWHKVFVQTMSTNIISGCSMAQPGS